MEEPWGEEVALEYLQSFPIYWSRRNFIERNIPVFKKMNILESGSGPAHDSLVFAEKGAKITAVDISKNAIENAKRIYSRLGYPIETFVADITRLPFENNSFDLVWNAGTLEHFEDAKLDKAFKEMVRVTKENGVLLVIVPNRYYFWYQWHLRLQKFRHKTLQYNFERAFSVFHFKKLFRKYNLKHIKVSGDYIHPAPSFIIPGLILLTRALKQVFAPLENSRKIGSLKSVLGLEIAIWGRK